MNAAMGGSMSRAGTARVVFFAGLLAASAGPSAQKAVHEADSVSETATIEGIDHDTRTLTLKDRHGTLEDISVGPEVKRFDELKVGDTITFTYYESIVYQIRKPGEPSSLAPSDAAVVRSTGPKPGATVSRQRTATVTVEAIDPSIPSISVRTASGHKLSGKVDVTYTEALMISVANPKR